MSKLNLICSVCGKGFQRYPSQLVSPDVYCSRSCQNTSRQIHIYQCKNCGKIFHRPVRKIDKTPECCSKKCQFEYYWKFKAPLKNNCICQHCGKIFYKTLKVQEKGEGKYCSRDCKNIYQTGRYDNGNTPVHYYNLANWRRVRIKVLERDNYKCIRCGGKEKLQVNHIKFRQLGGKDTLDNLETLCNKCHPIVDNERLKELTGNNKARMRDWKKNINVL